MLFVIQSRLLMTFIDSRRSNETLVFLSINPLLAGLASSFPTAFAYSVSSRKIGIYSRAS